MYLCNLLLTKRLKCFQHIVVLFYWNLCFKAFKEDFMWCLCWCTGGMIAVYGGKTIFYNFKNKPERNRGKASLNPSGRRSQGTGGKKTIANIRKREGTHTHTYTQRQRTRKKAWVCLCAHNVSLCAPVKRRKWEKYAWVSQVTGLRGHIIDPFGGKMTGL